MDNSKLRVSNGSGEAVRALVTVLRTPGSTVLNINTSVNWPTGQFVATAGPLLADGTLDPAKMLVFLTHVVGSTLVIDAFAPGYTDTYGNGVGDVVVIKPNTWWADQVASAAESMENFIEEQGDWRSVGTTISSVTYNGNRSYTAVLGADKSTILNPKMRLRSTRGTAAPTQSTSLNGTNQYWQDTTVTGMTWTDDFCTGAWIKLSSYPIPGTYPGIISRTNGTNGWQMSLTPAGQVFLQGNNGGTSNNRGVNSYQSLPLNKWVQITAELDMSAHTVSPTTSYIMIDGVDVPSYVFSTGTNPTALVQAGNLEVGSNGSGVTMPGKIAQAWVSSAKITQANARNLMSQGLTSALISAHAIASAYSFDGNGNDLNTTNANNLTAMNGATATNADSPFGGQANGTISSTKDYGIIQRVVGTSVTFQVPEGCAVPTSGTVTLEYSTMAAPYGFPGDIDKWRVLMMAMARINRGATTSGTYYVNQGITIPVGKWAISMRGQYYAGLGAAGTISIGMGLHTSAGVTDDKSVLATRLYMLNIQELGLEFNTPRSMLDLSAATFYYQNEYCNGTYTVMGLLQDFAPTIISAENAYL